MKTVSLLRNDIEKTVSFQNLSKIQKSIVLTRPNVLHIQNAVNVCLNIGVENWEKQTGFSNINKQIVKEIFHSQIIKS